jgi:hypothetical protein
MVILEGGSRARLQVTTVETRFQARGLALFGDRLAEAARAYSPAGGPLKAYVKAAGAECRALGEDVEFVSGSRMDIRKLSAFAALFLARDGDVPFSVEISRAAA